MTTGWTWIDPISCYDLTASAWKTQSETSWRTSQQNSVNQEKVRDNERTVSHWALEPCVTQQVTKTGHYHSIQFTSQGALETLICVFYASWCDKGLGKRGHRPFLQGDCKLAGPSLSHILLPLFWAPVMYDYKGLLPTFTLASTWLAVFRSHLTSRAGISCCSQNACIPNAPQRPRAGNSQGRWWELTERQLT